MIYSGLLIGFLYGFVSSKGQFCMNSGFSNVIRKKDTIKLKSYLSAILIQMSILPLLFVLLSIFNTDFLSVNNIGLTPILLLGNVIGGFLFGIFMYYAGGCGAGIFYKLGEKNGGAIIAIIGFALGLFLVEKSFLHFLKGFFHSNSVNQSPIWQGYSNALLLAIFISILSIIGLFILLRKKDAKPGNALWGWKKTGVSIGIIALIGWITALLSNITYGMSIIPGVLQLTEFTFTWTTLFVIGIPVGAFWAIRKIEGKVFSLPKKDIFIKRFFGGLGMGISGSVAAGCTVGHGLTFVPLLGIGSLVAILSIFAGSGLVGYLTRK